MVKTKFLSLKTVIAPVQYSPLKEPNKKNMVNGKNKIYKFKDS